MVENAVRVERGQIDAAMRVTQAESLVPKRAV
jgi:hypothetical protein